MTVLKHMNLVLFLVLNLPITFSVLRGTARHKNRSLAAQIMSQSFNLSTEESGLEKYCELNVLKCI